MVSARVKTQQSERIAQCDIFENIEIIESVTVDDNKLHINRINFPYVICLNQDCDLESDYRDKNEGQHCKDCQLLHLIVAPVFLFEEFLDGVHWETIFSAVRKQKRTDTSIRKIMNNEDPRFHFLHFPEGDRLPEMIIDFKHFFTINTEELYKMVSNRLCCMDELYREKISQRFAYYISRIGLPEL